jgi:methyl-accepting chemotaxis protein
MLMATTLVGFLLSGVGFLAISFVVERHQVRADVIQLAELVGDGCRAAISFNIPEDAKRVLDSLSTRPSIRSAFVTTPSGEFIARYGAGDDGVDVKPVGTGGARFDKAGLTVTAPIGPAADPLGYVTLFDDLRVIHDHRMIHLLVILFAALIALPLAYVFALRMRNYVASPILALTRASQEVGRKRDYSVRVERVSDDEVGELVTSFNHMLAEI